MNKKLFENVKGKCKDTGLSEKYLNRYPSELSGGQQQRIGVARALAADPDVMLFDEPFGAIDAITRNDLQEELQAIHQKLNQKTFVFITHDIYEAFKLGTRVVIMDNGTICQFDTPENIIKNPGNEFDQSYERLLGLIRGRVASLDGANA